MTPYRYEPPKPTERVEHTVNYQAPCPCGAEASWRSVRIQPLGGMGRTETQVDCPACDGSVVFW